MSDLKLKNASEFCFFSHSKRETMNFVYFIYFVEIEPNGETNRLRKNYWKELLKSLTEKSFLILEYDYVT